MRHSTSMDKHGSFLMLENYRVRLNDCNSLDASNVVTTGAGKTKFDYNDVRLLRIKDLDKTSYNYNTLHMY